MPIHFRNLRQLCPQRRRERHRAISITTDVLHLLLLKVPKLKTCRIPVCDISGIDVITVRNLVPSRYWLVFRFCQI